MWENALQKLRRSAAQDPEMECSTATSSDDMVISHFCKQIFHAFGHPNKETAILKKKWRVAATSSWYFRHFYVNNSLLDHDPRLVMLCCMFLAGKTEDSFVNIVDLLKIYNKATEARVLECEILLLEGLEFNLKVFHPQNCLYSIIADIKRREQAAVSAAASAGTTGDPAAGEARRQRVPELLHRWQATCEEYLIVVQCSSLVRQVSALSLALSVMKVAAPEGLEEAMGLQAYLVEKFTPEYLANEVDLYVDAVRELVAQEHSAEGQAQREETLRACILELRSRNRWKRSGSEGK